MSEEQKQELIKLIERVKRHQDVRGMSDNAFAIEYKSYIGSAKTWRQRLLAGNFEGVNIERILKKMRAFVCFLDGGSSSSEETFDDLPIFTQFMSRFRTLQSVQNDRRVMVFLGDTGVGKSVCAKYILRNNPNSTAYVRCKPTWRNNNLAILNGILSALGKDQMTRATKALNAVIDILKSTPLTILIDEAHEADVAILKLVKCLVDETQCRFVLMAFPTTWKKMLLASSEAYAEARQLFGRSQRPIFDKYQTGTTVENIEILLRHGTKLGDASKDLARQLLEKVRHNGNLRFVADILTAAEQHYMENENEIDGALLLSIADSLVARR